MAEAKKRLAHTFTFVGVTEVCVNSYSAFVRKHAFYPYRASTFFSRALTAAVRGTVSYRPCLIAYKIPTSAGICSLLFFSTLSRYMGSIWLAARVFGWGEAAVFRSLVHPVHGFRTERAEKRKAVPFTSGEVSASARAEVEAKEACDVVVREGGGAGEGCCATLHCAALRCAVEITITHPYTPEC